MELWQMDITGEVRLVDGTELKVVTGLDDLPVLCVGDGGEESDRSAWIWYLLGAAIALRLLRRRSRLGPGTGEVRR